MKYVFLFVCVCFNGKVSWIPWWLPCVSKNDNKFLIFVFVSSECWDYIVYHYVPFYMVLGIETRASCILHKLSGLWAMSSAPFKKKKVSYSDRKIEGMGNKFLGCMLLEEIAVE